MKTDVCVLEYMRGCVRMKHSLFCWFRVLVLNSSAVLLILLSLNFFLIVVPDDPTNHAELGSQRLWPAVHIQISKLIGLTSITAPVSSHLHLFVWCSCIFPPLLGFWDDEISFRPSSVRAEVQLRAQLSSCQQTRNSGSVLNSLLH